jgi:transaldolase
MIKVPGTRAGLSAIGELIAAGINVNVTLLFSIERYEQAADAWLGGLEQHAAAGAPLTGVASVASFFLSRIDALVDELLDRQVTAGRKEAATLRGESAIACARLAYKRYHARVASPRWQALAAQGAQPQRLLWASTSTKDPAYHDLKYVESLIGPETVNTLTPETFAAFRDHGRPAAHLTEEMEHAHTVLARLAQLDIDMAAAGRQLEDEGVEKFVQPFDALHATLANRVQALRAPPSEAGL